MAALQTCCLTLALLAVISLTLASKPYELIKTEMTWNEANKYCKRNGRGGLLTLSGTHDYWTMSALAECKGVEEGFQIWLDATKVGSTDGNFYFTQTDIGFPNVAGTWYPGEPNNEGGNQNCLVGKMTSGLLRFQDYDCDTQKFWFICSQ